MMDPRISVVMGVYNEERRLAETIKSILLQGEVDLELIVVNDGSTDDTEAIVQEVMKEDARVILINQSNGGLTKALISGCKRAQGKFIARHDAGDTSEPNRLKAQFDMLMSNDSIVMCSTGVVFVAPDGEEFNYITQDSKAATLSLKQSSIEKIEGPPHHGSVMFRRSTYRLCGGYRPEFLVAQDLDLWTRMIEYGDHAPVPEILYRAVANKNSISSLQRQHQIETAKLILDCCAARKSQGSDQEILRHVLDLNANMKDANKLKYNTDSDFYYFLGSCLETTNPSASKKYLKRAFISNPFNWKALTKLIGL